MRHESTLLSPEMVGGLPLQAGQGEGCWWEKHSKGRHSLAEEGQGCPISSLKQGGLWLFLALCHSVGLYRHPHSTQKTLGVASGGASWAGNSHLLVCGEESNQLTSSWSSHLPRWLSR